MQNQKARYLTGLLILRCMRGTTIVFLKWGFLEMFRIDLHNHTVYSGDSTLEPEEAVRRAIELGLGGIAFTEHNTFLDPEVIARLRERYAGSAVILSGIEYTSREGHLLVFGYTDAGFGGLGLYGPARDLIRLVGERGGVVIPAHPFREWSLFKGDLNTLSGIVAIEAYNGHNTKEENELAVSFSRKSGIPTTGGSDSHDVDDVGRCCTEFSVPVADEAAFISELKAGRFHGVSLRPSGYQV